MKKKDIQKLINLDFLESQEILTIYGQEIMDSFLTLLVDRLIKEGFKHYNQNFILNNNYQGKFYRLNHNFIEIMTNEANINNEALDLQYFFSKFLKDTLGIALIEGYRVVHNYNYYYGYFYSKEIVRIYEIKQNKKMAYLKFDLLNIFYSILNENDYLSYLLVPHLIIIPLHQNKNGVLSYANKVKEKLKIKSVVDDRNISVSEKKKNALNKKMPIIIYLGPKETKHLQILIEINNQKIELAFDEINMIEEYLIKSLKNKFNENLKNIYSFEKEITDLGNLKKVIKVNLCNNCQIEKYKYFLTPFNRINKNHKCLLCHQKVDNIVLLRK